MQLHEKRKMFSDTIRSAQTIPLSAIPRISESWLPFRRRNPHRETTAQLSAVVFRVQKGHSAVALIGKYSIDLRLVKKDSEQLFESGGIAG